MKKPKIYQGNKITGKIEMTGAEIDKVKQLLSEGKENRGFITLKESKKHLFVDESQKEINPNATIRRGVEIVCRKDEKAQTYLAYNERYFITDKKSNVYGKISIGKDKMARVDIFFDPVKEGEIVDFGAKGVASEYNTEETLYYTNKKSFTVFFATLEIPEQKEDTSEL